MASDIFNRAVASNFVSAFFDKRASQVRKEEAPWAEKGWFSRPSKFNLKDTPIPFLQEKQAEFGSTFRLKLGAFPTTFVLKPDSAFLRQFFRAGEHELGLYKTLLARGILIPFAGEKLPDRSTVKFVFYEAMPVLRRKLVPAIGKRTLSDEFNEAFQKILDELPKTGAFDSHEFFSHAIASMTVRALLGPDLAEHADQLVKLVERLVALVTQSERSSWAGYPAIMLRAAGIHREFRKIIEPVIRQRRGWQEENPSNWLAEHDLHDLLSFLLDAFMPSKVMHLSPEQLETGIRMALITALYGAFANTVAAVEGTLLCTLNDPILYDEVVEDIAHGCAELEDNGKETAETAEGETAGTGDTMAALSLKNLPFLHACFTEFLRVNPSTFLTRMVEDSPMKLPGGYIAKPGTMVAVVPWTIMHDPENYPNPHTFDPYRVFDEGFVDAERDSMYVSFGAGLHKCKGMKLAFQEIKVAVGMLIRDYHVELAEPFPGIPLPHASNVPSPSKSVRIKFAKRAYRLGAKISQADCAVAMSPSCSRALQAWVDDL